MKQTIGVGSVDDNLSVAPVTHLGLSVSALADFAAYRRPNAAHSADIDVVLKVQPLSGVGRLGYIGIAIEFLGCAFEGLGVFWGVLGCPMGPIVGRFWWEKRDYWGISCR